MMQQVRASGGDVLTAHEAKESEVRGHIDSMISRQVAEYNSTRDSWERHVASQVARATHPIALTTTPLPNETTSCIVVLTFDRPDSLRRLLAAIGAMHFGRDHGRVALTISIDAPRPGAKGCTRFMRNESIDLARNFHFPAGKVRVRARSENVGLLGQWIDAWTPDIDHTDAHEACLVVEDDLEPSAFAWRWMRRALSAYHVSQRQSLVATLGLNRPRGVQASECSDGLMPPPGTGGRPYLYRLLSSWGTVFLREHWICFRAWYRRLRAAGRPSFAAPLTASFRGKPLKGTLGYAHAMAQYKADSMWTMYFLQVRSMHPGLGGVPSGARKHRSAREDAGMEGGEAAAAAAVGVGGEGRGGMQGQGAPGRRECGGLRGGARWLSDARALCVECAVHVRAWPLHPLPQLWKSHTDGQLVRGRCPLQWQPWDRRAPPSRP